MIAIVAIPVTDQQTAIGVGIANIGNVGTNVLVNTSPSTLTSLRFDLSYRCILSVLRNFK